MSSGFVPTPLCDARTEERAVDGDADKRDDFRLQSGDAARELRAASNERCEQAERVAVLTTFAKALRVGVD